jgi:hypothetical protein
MHQAVHSGECNSQLLKQAHIACVSVLQQLLLHMHNCCRCARLSSVAVFGLNLQPPPTFMCVIMIVAVLHDLQTGGLTTTWQWTALGLTQLAEILVVAGEQCSACVPCTAMHFIVHQKPVPLHQLSSCPPP